MGQRGVLKNMVTSGKQSTYGSARSHINIRCRWLREAQVFPMDPDALQVEEITVILITEPIITLLLLLSQILSTSSPPFCPFFSMTKYLYLPAWSLSHCPSVLNLLLSLTYVSLKSGCVSLSVFLSVVTKEALSLLVSSLKLCHCLFLLFWNAYKTGTLKYTTFVKFVTFYWSFCVKLWVAVCALKMDYLSQLETLCIITLFVNTKTENELNYVGLI